MSLHRMPLESTRTLGMRQREHHCQEADRNGRSKNPFHCTPAGRCEERLESRLQTSGSTKESGLEPGPAARGFRNLEEKLTICACIPEGRHDAIVAIHLDRQPKPIQLPPKRQVPGKETDQNRESAKQPRIMRRTMFFLVPHDVLHVGTGKSEHPLRQHHS